MQPQNYHITPPLEPEHPTNDTSKVEPTESELSNSDWIEIDEDDWTDEQLKDDSRPGRRTGQLDQVTAAPDRVSYRTNRKYEKRLRQKNSAESSEWEIIKTEECWPSTADILNLEAAYAAERKKKSRGKMAFCIQMLSLGR